MDTFDFGLRLRELRKNRKLSQPQIAEMLNLTRSAISSYENNLSVPSPDVLIGLAGVYRVSVDYLLGIENDRTIKLRGLSERQIKLIEQFIDFITNECP